MNLQQSLIFIAITTAITFVIISILRFVTGIILSIVAKRLYKKISKKNTKGATTGSKIDNGDEKKLGNIYVNVTRMPKAEEAAFEEPNYNRKEVVGIVKPSGKFSAMIMGEKISYLMQNIRELKADIQKDGKITINKLKAHSHDTKGRSIKRSL
jgi:hypothetical protein